MWRRSRSTFLLRRHCSYLFTYLLELNYKRQNIVAVVTTNHMALDEVGQGVNKTDR